MQRATWGGIAWRPTAEPLRRGGHALDELRLLAVTPQASRIARSPDSWFHARLWEARFCGVRGRPVCVSVGRVVPGGQCAQSSKFAVTDCNRPSACPGRYRWGRTGTPTHSTPPNRISGPVATLWVPRHMHMTCTCACTCTCDMYMCTSASGHAVIGVRNVGNGALDGAHLDSFTRVGRRRHACSRQNAFRAEPFRTFRVTLGNPGSGR